VDNTDPSSDTILAKRVAAGNEEALQVFFERYADPLFAFIYHHLNSAREDAEEVWQTTLLAAMHSASAFSGESRLFTWLCAIARHKITDFRRRTGKPTDVFSDVPSQQLLKLMATSPLPEEVVLQRTTRILVVKALATLPDDYRSALLARYIDDLPVTEISDLLGRSYKATESLLSRAREALRQRLEHLEEKHGEN
jgi:RNA polymerase sigma-70 factor (ECF subfamily)